MIASVGDDVTLACTAEGHPKPRLSWTRCDNPILKYKVLDLKSVALARSGKKLEGGDEKVTGDTMTLLRVTPEEAGVYICTASNQHSRLFSLAIEFVLTSECECELLVGQSVGGSRSMLSTSPRLNWRKWWCRYLKQT